MYAAQNILSRNVPQSIKIFVLHHKLEYAFFDIARCQFCVHDNAIKVFTLEFVKYIPNIYI